MARIGKEWLLAAGVLITACADAGVVPTATQATESPPALTSTEVASATDALPTAIPTMPPVPPSMVAETPIPIPMPTPEIAPFTDETILGILTFISLNPAHGLDVTKNDSTLTTIYPWVEPKVVDSEPHTITLNPGDSVLVPFRVYPYVDSQNLVPGAVGFFLDNSTSPAPPSFEPCDVTIIKIGRVTQGSVNEKGLPQFVDQFDTVLWPGSEAMGPFSAPPDPEFPTQQSFGYVHLFNADPVPCSITLSVFPPPSDFGIQALALTQRS